MKVKLCLIGINPYESREGDQRYSCIFISEAGKGYKGTTGNLTPELEAELCPNGYDSARARDWEVQPNIWDEKLTYTVLIP